MGYNRETWKRRIAERTDLSTQIAHLTRELGEATNRDVIKVLFKIMDEQRLIGSTTDRGFIVGARPAVCFQDVPLVGICQNVFYEQKYREQNPKTKLRYRAIGIAFPKDYAFRKGARPVIYDETLAAKQYLPKDEWWRIVNFDLGSDEKFIDWTHEREWRVPDEFLFEREMATLLFVNEASYKSFSELCKRENKPYLDEVKGIVVMDNLLF